MALIEDYALIGDCRTAALVSRDGSIDWYCCPRFDSEACFAALLGTREHGRWSIAPQEPARITRRYRPKTLVLETHFETEEGAATLIDFMPLDGHHSTIVRLVRGVRGRVSMGTELILRFGYGAIVPWVTRLEDGGLRAIAGPDMMVLRTPVQLRGVDMTTVGTFVIYKDETIPFVLSYYPSHRPLHTSFDPTAALHDTEMFWQEWSAKCRPAGPWSDVVLRSMITLKALTYAPTGGMVAAPTTSLPERLGGERNWDYRYCWLRDATLVLLGAMNAGYFDEAQAWREWLLRAVAGSPGPIANHVWHCRRAAVDRMDRALAPRLRKLGAGADRQCRPQPAPARRVRRDHGRPSPGAPPRAVDQRIGMARATRVPRPSEKIWREPDEGIWEVRGGPRQFTHSKVMAWVAFDRAIKSAETFGLGRADRRMAQAARRNLQRGSPPKALTRKWARFVQAYGTKFLDASLLLLPAVGFLPVSDPRMEQTIAAIERRLLRDGFVMRYDTAVDADGLPPGEGAFLACSFWLVDVYVLQGRMADAERLFRRLIAVRNDLGLLSEEYDPHLKRQIGNFPQAFSHMALVNSRLQSDAPRKAGRAARAAGI